MMKGVIFTLEMALVIAFTAGVLALLIPMLSMPEVKSGGGYGRSMLAVIEKSGMLEECAGENYTALENFLETHEKCINLSILEYDEDKELVRGLPPFSSGECSPPPDSVVVVSRVSFINGFVYVTRARVSR